MTQRGTQIRTANSFSNFISKGNALTRIGKPREERMKNQHHHYTALYVILNTKRTF